jgi:hypothetical protein
MKARSGLLSWGPGSDRFPLLLTADSAYPS